MGQLITKWHKNYLNAWKNRFNYKFPWVEFTRCGTVVCVLDYIGKMVPASGGALFEVLWWYAVHLVRLQTESKSWQVSTGIVVSHQLL